MEENELLMPSRLLTGYIPGAEALSAVEKLATKLRHARPSFIYLLDPVMGDAGRLYVAADVIPVYREMLPLVTIITPNWFEAEVLTGVELKDLASLREALSILHLKYHVPHVVITSIIMKPWLVEALPPSIRPPEGDHLLCITSSLSPRQGNSDSRSHPSIIHAQCVSTIPGYFSGVGDLFSALLLAHFHPEQPPSSPNTTALSEAVFQALAKTHTLLQLTHERAMILPEEERAITDDELDSANPLRRTRRMRGRELALIEGQDIIRGIGLDDTQPLIPWFSFWTQ